MSIVNEPSVISDQDGAVITLMISRPQSLNALNVDVLQSLIDALQKLESNKEARAVILRGAGEKAFVAGADIRTMVGLGPRAIAEYVELGQRTFRLIERCHLPVIAVVSGYALGGGLELALAADLIFASKTAKLGQPEVNLGIIPGFGGTQRLLQRVGVGAARCLCMSGDLVEAEAAQVMGLVDKVFEPEDIFRKSREWVVALTEKPPLAVQAVKRVLRQSVDGQVLAGLRHEVEAFLEVFATADREEGMQAFLEKRKGSFCGR